MERRTIAEVLAHCGEGPIVALGDVALEPRAPEAQPGAEAQIAIGRVRDGDPAAVTEQLRAAVRVGGVVVLIASHGGLLGALGAAPKGPELTTLAETLLGAGLLEVSAAITPGTLRRDLLVWATLKER